MISLNRKPHQHYLGRRFSIYNVFEENQFTKKKIKCLVLRKRKGKEKKNESVWLQEE
jgi:hypothetical protein